MNIQDYYKHSWFSDLAYVNWDEDSVGVTGNFRSAIRDANAVDAMRAPSKLTRITTASLPAQR